MALITNRWYRLRERAHAEFAEWEKDWFVVLEVQDSRPHIINARACKSRACISLVSLQQRRKRTVKKRTWEYAAFELSFRVVLKPALLRRSPQTTLCDMANHAGENYSSLELLQNGMERDYAGRFGNAVDGREKAWKTWSRFAARLPTWCGYARVNTLALTGWTIQWTHDRVVYIFQAMIEFITASRWNYLNCVYSKRGWGSTVLKEADTIASLRA